MNEEMKLNEDVKTANGYEKDVELDNQTRITAIEEEKEKFVETEENVAETDEGNIDNANGLPVDRGWAWAVLAGCVLYITLWGAVVRSYGVFFLQFQERFHAKAAEVAVMNIIQNIVASITGLFTMTVILKKCSCRTVVAVGGFLNALSHIISGVTRDIRVFYFSQGLFGGAGIAMVGPPMTATIGVYFKRHRGLANSIFTASASVGGLIFAPVVTKLFEDYGYTGTMLIMAGFILNSFVSAAVMRPPSWFSKRGMKEEEGKLLENKQLECYTERISENCPVGSEADCVNIVETTVESVTICDDDTPDNRACNSEYSLNIVDDQTTAVYKTNLKKKADLMYSKNSISHVSGEGLHVSFASLQTDFTEKEKSAIDNNRSCLSTVRIAIADFISTFDYKLLKDALFLLFLAMAFVTLSGMILLPIYLPPFAKDNGLSYDEIAVMISVLASVDVASKIVSGIIADRQWIPRSYMLAFAAFATGTVCHFARYCVNKSLIMAMTVLIACFYGWYTSMYATILIDTIGLEKFQSSLGFVSVIHGLSVAVFFPLSGYLRDISGTYVSSLHLAGGLCYLGTVLLVLLVVMQKRKQNS